MIGLIFDNPILLSQDLGNHIENNLYTGSVCINHKYLNPVAQTFTSYVYTTIAPGFDTSANKPIGGN